MRFYPYYAASVAALGLVAAITIIISVVCPYIDEKFKGHDESDRKLFKAEYSEYFVIFIAAFVCLLITIVKRREFFSIFAPIFIGLPSAILLSYLFTNEAYVLYTVQDFSLKIIIPLQYLLFAMQYLRSSLTVPIYFELIGQGENTNRAREF